MVKIVHDELTQLMGGETAEINIDARPAVILMSGLQGSGKTTFSGKLARMLKTKKNRKPLLVACDVYRPADVYKRQQPTLDLLPTLCDLAGIPVPAEKPGISLAPILKGEKQKKTHPCLLYTSISFSSQPLTQLSQGF